MGLYQESLRSIPLSRGSISSEHVTVSSSEKLPLSVAEEIKVNPLAKESLDPVFSFLLEPKFFLNNCYVTVPIETTDHKILSPSSWGRSLPVGYGYFSYNNEFVGGVVMAKGTFLNGEYLKLDPQKSKNYFYGFNDAESCEEEINISNQLLASGFRSSLPLGYVTLKPKLLENFLVNRWRNEPNYKEIVENGLNYLASEKGIPAIMFRLSGTTERMIFLQSKKYADRLSKRRKAELSRAARLFLREAQLFPSSFVDKLGGDKTLAKNIFSVLTSISERKKIDNQGMELFATWVLAIVKTNEKALSRLLSKNSSFKNIGSSLSSPKDTDLALFSQDFEEIHLAGDSNPIQDELFQYSQRMNFFIGNFLAEAETLLK